MTDLASVPREVLAVVAAVAVALLLAQILVLGGKRWARRRRMSLRMERAVAGEERAPEWLEDRGYSVVGAQVVTEHPVRVDDRVVMIVLRADYLVEKDGARYVVEVKTGALAPRIETSATRRQLLEYRVAFDVDGVLLLDAETGELHAITFPALSTLEPRSRPSTWSWRVAMWGIAALVAAIVAARLV